MQCYQKSIKRKYFVTYIIIRCFNNIVRNFFLSNYNIRILTPTLETQNVDGGWGLHIEGHSTMFCTALNYVTLRLLGEDINDEAMEKARKWILEHGGLTFIPSWGKLWLSVS